NSSVLDQNVSPRGYRILDKLPRLPVPVIENLVREFGSLQQVLNASISELDAVEGIGEVRARSIKEGLNKCRELLKQERLV
ncbi:MAG: helix-hairpin-helix domain-containing protein, partial [Bacillota bacterium]